jgi:hypothetical protein
MPTPAAAATRAGSARLQRRGERAILGHRGAENDTLFTAAIHGVVESSPTVDNASLTTARYLGGKDYLASGFDQFTAGNMNFDIISSG